MRLHVIIPAAHNRSMTMTCSDYAGDNAALESTKVHVFDNGVGLGAQGDGVNCGNYPVFFRVKSDADVLLFIHNDLYIYEPGYDKRILEAFQDPDLAVLGFCGSDQFDYAGGRGWMCWTNYQGKDKRASTAEEHGERVSEFRAAANLDGCAMAFRRRFLEELPEDPTFPPHHFYDRLFCAEAIDRGYRVGYLGIACDHLNGRTSGDGKSGYNDLARDWCEAHNVKRTLVQPDGEPKPDSDPGFWDQQIYLEAEAQFLDEWSMNRKFIPLRVGQDFATYHENGGWAG